MPNLSSKLNKLVALKFDDKTMETEYYKTKTKNSLTDFKAATYLMIALNLIGLIIYITHRNYATLPFIITSMILNFTLIIFQRVIIKKYQYLFVFALFYFSVSRLIILLMKFEISDKVTILFHGYLYASSLIVVLCRIQNQYIKILIILVTMAIRYGVLIHISPDSFVPLNWLRCIFTDLFISYLSISNEKSERKVFQTYYENRDELIKFKELLTYSLPQSVTVVDFQTQKQLFANNSFLESFDWREIGKEESPDVKTQKTFQSKPNLNMLKLDSNTLREVGSSDIEESITLNLTSCTLSLMELLKKLAEGDVINERTLSIHASYQSQDKQRTFHIIFKKIKWERTDALAIILNDTTFQESYFALKQANRNKDQIIATVSHELRTPLHGIIGLLEIVETKVSDEETNSHLSLCKDNAQLLLSLVNSLLDLQQLSTGKLKLHQSEINITKTLNDVIQLFKFQCDNKNISLELEIQKAISCSILTDEDRLKQILINLIGNAVKFTFQGGIKVEVTQHPEQCDYLVISVNDTGVGIKEEDLGNLFKMYGKLADPHGVNKNGIGLGLTIANTLAGLLNGQDNENASGIKVTSQYGVGTKFSFRVLKSLYNSISSDAGHENSLRKLSEDNKVPKILNLSIEAILKSADIEPLRNGDSSTGSKDSIDKDFEENPSSPDLSSKLASCLWKVRDTPTSRYRKSSDEPSFALSDKDKKEDQTLLPQSAKNSQYRSELLSRFFPRKECILVVDDNPFNILVARSLLKDTGYEFKTAYGGQEAIDIVRDCNQEGMKIKTIFLDCQMPIMDGYETARILTSMMKHGEVPKVPIWAWTANNSEQDINRCYESGMTGYLSKPTTRENVLKILQK